MAVDDHGELGVRQKTGWARGIRAAFPETDGAQVGSVQSADLNVGDLIPGELRFRSRLDKANAAAHAAARAPCWWAEARVGIPAPSRLEHSILKACSDRARRPVSSFPRYD